MIDDIFKIGKQIVGYSFGRFTVALITLTLTPIFTHLFLPKEYGIISFFIMIIAILNSIFMLGFDSAMARYYYNTEDDLERKKIISTSFYFILFIYLFSVIIFIIKADAVSLFIFKDVGYSTLFVITFIVSFFSLINNFIISLFQVLMKPSYYFYVTVVNSILYAIFALYFIIIIKSGIIGILYGYLFANIISAIFGLFLSKSNFVLIFSFRILKALVKYGFPLIFASAASLILITSDRFFLIRFTTFEEVGLYSLGLKISSIMLLFSAGFQLALGPFALSIYKKKDSNQTFVKILKHFTVLSCFFALSLTIFSKEIITVLSRDEYLAAFKVVAPLSLSMIAYGSYYIASLGVVFVKKTGYIAITFGFAALINIVLNFFMVQYFGMMGVAITTLFSHCISAYLLYLVSQHYYPIPFNVKEVSIVWLLTIIFMSISLIFNYENILFSLMIKIILLIFFIISILYLKILRKDEISPFVLFLRNLLRKFNIRFKIL